MAKIKVLVVDDSALMRRMISDLLSMDAAMEVCGTASNGKDAIDAVWRLSPDVVTLDVEMPVMNGLQALPQIADRCPVIMLSSLTKAGAETTVRALEEGAFDFVAKPSGSISLDISRVGERLREMVKAAAQGRTSRFGRSIPVIPPATKDLEFASSIQSIIGIGTSTGGPRALTGLLPMLPTNLPMSMLIVQHMPPGFTASLAARLNQVSMITVEEAADGAVLMPSHAYIAPGGSHMIVRQEPGHRYRIALHMDLPQKGHRPSVDVLFHSLAKLKDVRLCAALLTGMGTDGADGMVALKERGAHTIAEAESTCAVFGMPKAAIHRRCVDVVKPLDQIAKELSSIAAI